MWLALPVPVGREQRHRESPWEVWVALASSTNQEGSATTTPSLRVPRWEQAKRLNRLSKALCKGMGQAGAGYTQGIAQLRPHLSQRVRSQRGAVFTALDLHSGSGLSLLLSLLPPAQQHLGNTWPRARVGLGVDRDDTSG